jgi:hypothetical protein
MAEHDDTDLRTAAKAAAATAAVGAAVGVARALAARVEEAAHRNGDEPEQKHEHEEPETDAVSDTAPAVSDTAQEDEGEQEEEEREPVQGTSVGRLRRLTENARELLHELSGAEVESVSAVDRTGDGWRVTLETVEMRRVPDSMDVMATYDVELDGDGDLVRYERRRRYARSQSDHGDGR